MIVAYSITVKGFMVTRFASILYPKSADAFVVAAYQVKIDFS